MRNNTARGDQGQMTTPVREPIRTVTTTGHQSLLTAEQLTIDLNDVLFRMLEPARSPRRWTFPATTASSATAANRFGRLATLSHLRGA
ncbi:gp65 domain protein [Mycobacterium xenopi 3993]|nr:gp65 domain protein [Mycobacterium xenopi 3993]